MQDKLIIYEFSDPLCPWCWGSEPILRKLESRFDVQIRYIMVGMIEDVRKEVPDITEEGYMEYNDRIASKWEEQAIKHKMPVNPYDFSLFDNKSNSTWPLCISYKAAEFQDLERANRLLRRFREQIFLEGKKAIRNSSILSTVVEVGLDLEQYIEDVTGGKAEKAFLEDIELAKKHKITSYPSYLFRYKGEEVVVRGFTYYQTMKALIKGLTDAEIGDKGIEISKMMDVINRYDGIAIYELAEIFEIEYPRLHEILNDMSQNNEIIIEEHGENIYVRKNKKIEGCSLEGC